MKQVDSAIIDGQFLVQAIDERFIAYVPIEFHGECIAFSFDPANIKYLEVGATCELVPFNQNIAVLKALLKASV